MRFPGFEKMYSRQCSGQHLQNMEGLGKYWNHPMGKLIAVSGTLPYILAVFRSIARIL